MGSTAVVFETLSRGWVWGRGFFRDVIWSLCGLFFGLAPLVLGGDESSREVLYGALRFPGYGLIPRRRANEEGLWLPLSGVRRRRYAGIARRQLNQIYMEIT